MHVCKRVYMYACMYEGTYVCMQERVYARMHIHTYITLTAPVLNLSPAGHFFTAARCLVISINIPKQLRSVLKDKHHSDARTASAFWSMYVCMYVCMYVVTPL